MKRRLLCGTLATLGLIVWLAGPARAQGLQPIGAPFRITQAADGAVRPSVASGPDGSFTVVWLGRPAGTAAAIGLFARRYDTAGQPLNEPVLVSDVTFLDRPRIAVGPDGGALVVWVDMFASVVRVRRLAPDGQPAGATIEIFPPFSGCCQDSLDVAALPSGGFVLVWRNTSNLYATIPLFSFTPIQGLRVGADGHPKGEPFEIGGDGSTPRVAAAPDGGFAVAWEDHKAPFVRRFKAGGAADGQPVRVTPYNGFSPVPVYAPDGGLSVVWATIGANSFIEPTGVFATRIPAAAGPLGAGTPLAGAPIQPNLLDATADRRGDKLVAWTVPSSGGASEVRVRAFDASWQPEGSELTAGRFTTFPPRPFWAPFSLSDLVSKAPAIAAGPSSALTVWDGQLAAAETVSQVAGLLLSSGSCAQGAGDLCLAGGRFRVDVTWRNVGSGATGTGTAVPLTDDTGAFWFFGAANLELLVKVLDGRGVNGHWWVFFGALTDVEYDLTVTDLRTGNHKTWHNPAGTQASRADVNAFADPLNTSPPLLNLAAVAASPCTADGQTLCLNGERYQVTVAWTDPRTGASGTGHAVPLSTDSGYFWFFGAGNVELMVKVLDGRPVNGHVWVFYAALSDVDYTITVTDPVTHAVKTYRNPAGTLASRADTAAF
jgi:hypothetical protein